jgi:hypothetical protein
VNKFTFLLPVVMLAACSQEAPAPAPTAAATAAAPAAPKLAPPLKDDFVAAYAKACPKAKPVTTALCKSEGFGKSGFICEYGFGKYRRETAHLTPGDGEWVLADPEKACVSGDAS